MAPLRAARCCRAAIVAGALLMMLAAAAPGAAEQPACPPQPRTGCVQAATAALELSSVADGRVNFLTLTLTGLPENSPRRGAERQALCVYDPAQVPTTEYATPNPAAGGSSLLVGAPVTAIVSPSGPVTAKARLAQEQAAKLPAKGSRLLPQLLADDDDGACYALAASLARPLASNPFPDGVALPPLINAGLALTTLDKLVARYNAAAGGAPLNAAVWAAAAAPGALFSDLLAAADPLALDFSALTSAAYACGYWGGLWFQRDGFGGPAGAGVTPAGVGAVAGTAELYRNIAAFAGPDGIKAALTATYDNPQVPYSDVGTGIRSLARNFGYNLGYSKAVLGESAETLQPPANTLVCDASKPFACTFSPSFVTVPSGLANGPTKFAAAQPTATALLLGNQTEAAFIGNYIWTGPNPNAPPGVTLPPLVKFLSPAPAFRKAIWSVNNGFLGLIQGSAYANLLAQADDDVGVGRKALLAKGFLESFVLSYSVVGLNAPEPRVLPKFDLGSVTLA